MLQYNLAEVEVVKYPKRISKAEIHLAIVTGDVIQDVVHKGDGIYEGYVKELNAYILFKSK